MDITQKQKTPQSICNVSQPQSNSLPTGESNFVEIIPEQTGPSEIVRFEVDPLLNGRFVSVKFRQVCTDSWVIGIYLKHCQQIVRSTFQVAMVSGPPSEIEHQGQRPDSRHQQTGNLTSQRVLRNKCASSPTAQNNSDKQEPTTNPIKPAFTQVMVNGAMKQIKFEVVGSYFGGTTLGGWPFDPGDRVGADGCSLGVAGDFAHLISPISNISPLSLSHWGCGRSRHGTARPAPFDTTIRPAIQYVVTQRPVTTSASQEITCPPSRRQLLQNQQLRRAREIICQRTSYSAGAIDAAMRAIANLSPHEDAAMAKAALASRKVAA